jgi:hypothetical protein
VLRPQVTNTAGNQTVVRRVNLLEFETEEKVTVELVSIDDPNAGALLVQCGLLATFRARSVLHTPALTRLQKLVVFGEATHCTGADGGSPLIIPAASRSEDFATSKMYQSSTLRPFTTTIAIVFDISQPSSPVAMSMAQYEGSFEHSHLESHFAWLFISQTTHQPYAPADSGEPQDPAALSMSQVMPVFRTRQLRFTASQPRPDWSAFQVVSSCAVRQFKAGNKPSRSGSLLTAVPLPLQDMSDARGQRLIGLPQPSDHTTYALAWDELVRRLHLHAAVIPLLDAFAISLCSNLSSAAPLNIVASCCQARQVFGGAAWCELPA